MSIPLKELIERHAGGVRGEEERREGWRGRKVRGERKRRGEVEGEEVRGKERGKR